MSYIFPEVVETAIKNNDLAPAIAYLNENFSECNKDSKLIERLMNRAAHTNDTESIEQILAILREKAFLFDSVDYTNSIRWLINDG